MQVKEDEITEKINVKYQGSFDEKNDEASQKDTGAV
jgi:hypothetical protein